MTEWDHIVARIAKFQALASSQNANEAASAQAAARRLMDQHNVAQADVDAVSGADHVEMCVAGDWGADWRYALLTAAARHCGAEVVSFRVGQGRRVRMKGRKVDVDRGYELFKELQKALFKIRSSVYTMLRGSGDVALDIELSGRGWRWCLDRWHRGCVRGIVEILRDKDQAPRSSGLVPWKDRSRTVTLGKVQLGVKVVQGGLGGEATTAAWYQHGRQTAREQIEVRVDGAVSVRPSAKSLEDFFWG